jgi:putative tricarboxylic transport membrane protein
MIESFDFLMHGFAVALTPANLAFAFIGVLWGTVVGVLPGFGPQQGLVLLLPITFRLDPIPAIIMLTGIFYGAMYGGSTTSILVNIPGEAASVITCLDGYQMARQGRAGPALVIAALGSWVGGTVSIIMLMFFAPPLANVMLKVGPAETVAIMVMSLMILSLVGGGSPLKTTLMILLGLLLSTVGLDPLTVSHRYTFGDLRLTEGINFASLALGLFGISEILVNLEAVASVKPIRPTLRSLIPRRKDLADSTPAILRGTVIGNLMGIVPGVSHITSTFISYAFERRLSRDPGSFGKGRIEGVAGPEAANNATTGSSMIPLLVLGIPSIPATAVLVSALLIHGIQPGPQFLSQHPDLFWGLVASMYVGNLVLVALNLPLVGIFVNLLRIPYAYLAPGILLLCIVGVYSTSASLLDLWLMFGFGVLGYVLRKLDFDTAPLIMAFVLGDRIELSFRRALVISDGDFAVFVQSTTSKVVIAGIVLLVTFGLAASLRRTIRGRLEKRVRQAVG